jgi:hypothetical protein
MIFYRAGLPIAISWNVIRSTSSPANWQLSKYAHLLRLASAQFPPKAEKEEQF